MPTDLLLIGAGGHVKVVIDAIQAGKREYCIQLADQDSTKTGDKIFEKFVIKPLKNWSALPDHFHVAIGNNKYREQLNVLARDKNKQSITILHPNITLSDYAQVGKGCFVAARVIIGANSKIAEGCIINHGAIVDHDCIIEAYSHIAPNVTLGGTVIIGQGCLIGAGAIILPGIKVGRNVVIGAGAVITHDVLDNQIVVGVPGRCLRK